MGVEKEPLEAQSQPTDFPQLWREIQSYAAYYCAAQLDRARLTLRHVILFGLLLGAVIVFGGTFLIMAVVLACIGIAGGVSRLVGGSLWLGELITGASVLIFVLGIGYLTVVQITKTSRRRVLNAYEERAAEQRREFGADIHQRAAQNRNES